MISLLLALTLTTHCTVTTLAPQAMLVCDDVRRTELVIPLSEWPGEWSKPQVGASYPVSSESQPISDGEAILARSRAEQRRWLREAVQTIRER